MAVPKSRTRLTPEARRAQIIDVATRQIAEGGFNTFTLSRLAKAAGMTRAGVEHHFASREEILIEVLRHRDDLDARAVVDHFGSLPSDREMAFAALAAIVRRNSAQREIVRLYAILGAEALDPTHPAHDYFVERLAVSRELIASISRGWARDPDGFAVEVLGRMDGLQLQWLRDPALDLEALWAASARSFGDV